jgi:hypothetical protein
MVACRRLMNTPLVSTHRILRYGLRPTQDAVSSALSSPDPELAEGEGRIEGCYLVISCHVYIKNSIGDNKTSVKGRRGVCTGSGSA